MKSQILRVMIGAAILSAGGPMSSIQAGTAIQEGKPFPDLTLPALEDGRPRSITDLLGQKTILHIFASW